MASGGRSQGSHGGERRHTPTPNWVKAFGRAVWPEPSRAEAGVDPARVCFRLGILLLGKGQAGQDQDLTKLHAWFFTRQASPTAPPAISYDTLIAALLRDPRFCVFAKDCDPPASRLGLIDLSGIVHACFQETMAIVEREYPAGGGSFGAALCRHIVLRLVERARDDIVQQMLAPELAHDLGGVPIGELAAGGWRLGCGEVQPPSLARIWSFGAAAQSARLLTTSRIHQAPALWLLHSCPPH